MRYDVRWVQDDAELARLHALGASWNPAAQCSTGSPCPPLDEMHRVPRVYAAYLNEEPVAFALTSERPRMVWLTGHAAHIAAACVDIADVIHHELCDAWGVIENAELRAAIAAASDGRIVDDGECCRWVGE